jgi:hypothetical protein
MSTCFLPTMTKARKCFCKSAMLSATPQPARGFGATPISCPAPSPSRPTAEGPVRAVRESASNLIQRRLGPRVRATSNDWNFLGRRKRQRAFRAARFISADASLKLACSDVPNRMARLIFVLVFAFAHGDAPLWVAPSAALAIFSGETSIPASERFVERFLAASTTRTVLRAWRALHDGRRPTELVERRPNLLSERRARPRDLLKVLRSALRQHRTQFCRPSAVNGSAKFLIPRCATFAAAGARPAPTPAAARA